MTHTISYTGRIEFEPENRTKKHIAQAAWKKVAMIMFDGDVAEYYSWFLKKRFNLDLLKLHRQAHITFINDAFDDLNNRNGTNEEKEALWEKLKNKWDGKELSVILNLRPFSNVSTWWLIVDHKHREEIQAIRSEVGLSRPYFGLHMTFGNVHPYQIEHSEYINSMNEKGLLELNMDYRMENEIEIKRIRPEKCDLFNSKDELIGTLFNEYELNHVRIQIATKQLDGYYVMWKEQKIPIDANGKINIWPIGFYDTQENQLAELFKMQVQ